MSLSRIAEETVEIAERGWYALPSGARVSIDGAVRRAVEGTRLYRPGDYARRPQPEPSHSTQIAVIAETTSQAARRLVENEGARGVAALNFASAKNYDANRHAGSTLYTDHLIYSPEVPFFHDERHELLPAPFLVSILTSPAPNAGEASLHGEEAGVRETLERRARQLPQVAVHHRHEVLVLGAWGCGVFGNEPAVVADVFARLLSSEQVSGVFGGIVFASFDKADARSTLRALEDRWLAA